MMWAGGASTRILITCTIEWSKSSWIKGAIEKGANEGQISFAKDLVSELRRTLEDREGGAGDKRKNAARKKANRRRKDGQKEEDGSEMKKGEPDGSSQNNFGASALLIAGLTRIFRFLSSSTGCISILLVFVFCQLIRVERAMNQLSSGTSRETAEFRRGRASDVFAEEDLWDWIGSRIETVRKEVQDGHVIWNNLVKQSASAAGMNDVGDAIQVTERKLNALKGIVEKKQGLGSVTMEDI